MRLKLADNSREIGRSIGALLYHLSRRDYNYYYLSSLFAFNHIVCVLRPGHRRTNLLLLDDSMFDEIDLPKNPASKLTERGSVSVKVASGQSVAVSSKLGSSRPSNAQLNVADTASKSVSSWPSTGQLSVANISSKSVSSRPSSGQLSVADTSSASQRLSFLSYLLFSFRYFDTGWRYGGCLSTKKPLQQFLKFCFRDLAAGLEKLEC